MVLRSLRHAALVLALTGGGCQVEKLEPKAVCEDVASAIASRTFACSGDAKLANKRAEQFEGAYRCTADAQTNLEEVYLCPVAIQALPCDAVAQNGEAWDRWLATSDRCALVLAPGAGP